jgi:hypothetical protein
MHRFLLSFIHYSLPDFAVIPLGDVYLPFEHEQSANESASHGHMRILAHNRVFTTTGKGWSEKASIDPSIHPSTIYLDAHTAIQLASLNRGNRLSSREKMPC